DETSRQNAVYWGGKADTAKMLSDKMIADLETLKQDLINASGPKLDEDSNMTYKLDDLNASSRLMDTEKRGQELDQKLKAYRKAMLAIDPAIDSQFRSTFPVEVDESKDATTPQFRMMPTVAAVTLISKLQNNVKNAENQVVTFAHNKVGEVKVIYDKFVPIVGQSSTYLMPGDKMTVTAGIGAFNSKAEPTITIAGAAVPVNTEGVAIKEFEASGSGERSVPVVVTFTKPDGTRETVNYPLKYTVGTPGGAAVMLDKMNVFYIGVDNPVTIGSPTGWDKTQVSMTGGNISGSGSKRVVKVSQLGNATITVTADGDRSTFSFRVKRVPDPVFKIADGKPRIATVAFKNQQYCRAELENFDFDLKFNVVSAKVYFSGAGFSSVAQGNITGNSLSGISTQLQRWVPGSVVTFENIVVSGPGGNRTIEGRSFALY
ncbi:MAG TPA: GldM family protein, partial [Cyclobacteriaceae bacterium]|nr:GldM family protein [Cyclobacteriaceae bacterium]